MPNDCEICKAKERNAVKVLGLFADNIGSAVGAVIAGARAQDVLPIFMEKMAADLASEGGGHER